MRSLSLQMFSALFFAVAAASIVAFFYEPFPGRFILKAAPIWLLCWRVGAFAPGERLILAALVFGSLGDIALDLSFLSFAFPLGLGLFLIGNVLYAARFLREFKFRPLRLLLAAAVATYAAGIFWISLPKLGAMFWPVFAYLFAISAMAVAAAFSRKVSDWRLFTGAASFVVSDSLIALNLFYQPIPARALLVLGTYYLAQYLLAAAFFDRRDGAASSAALVDAK